MAQTNISVVVNNYFTETSKGIKVYSVVVSHEAEVHENYVYTDRDKAIAKMESVVEKWKNSNFRIHKYREDDRADFTPQYHTKMGYWYEDGDWEYGYVELVECVLE